MTRFLRVQLEFVLEMDGPVHSLPDGMDRLQRFILGGLHFAGVQGVRAIAPGIRVTFTPVSSPESKW